MKSKKIIFLICIIFVLMFLFSTGIGHNVGHLMCCEKEKCFTCDLIQYSINFNQNLNYIISYIILLGIVIPLIYALINLSFKFPQFSLVELKVRINE